MDLKPQGRYLRVTDSNKMEYLDCLAQYKLSTRYKDQTDLFLEGLHSVVPDQLLSLFDESELELILCGVREYDLNDWRTVGQCRMWRNFLGLCFFMANSRFFKRDFTPIHSLKIPVNWGL